MSVSTIGKSGEVGVTAAATDAAAAGGGVKSTVSVFGVRVELLITGEETHGGYALCRVTAEPGIGAPPHVHEWDDEAFYVVEGTIEFRKGGETLRLGPGAHVFLPRGVPHAFRSVGEEPGVMLEMVTPAGHERFFEDAGRLSFPPDPAEAAAVCERHGIRLLAP